MFRSKKWTAWLAVLVVVLAAALPTAALAAPDPAPAQQAVSGTCNGVTVSGSQAAVSAAMRLMGCVYVAPPTPSGLGVANSCVVTRSANLRSAPAKADNIVGAAKVNQIFEVKGHSADALWTETSAGWIWAAYCKLVPDTIETEARECHGFQRPDGFNMDWALDQNGTKYDVTIISTLPKLADGTLDFCDPYRVIQDGSHGSVLNDQLPQPPGNRTDAPEFVDFTFLANDWQDVEHAFYSGIAGRLLWDPDQGGPRGLEAVLDVNGDPVGFSENGEQFFEVAPYVGAWMSWQCVENCPFHWGFRLDPFPWTR